MRAGIVRKAMFGQSAVLKSVQALFAGGNPGAHFQTYNPDSLLVRTNYLTYSEDLTNAAWSKTNATIVPNADGASSKIVESTAAAVGHTVSQAISTSQSLVYVARLKAAERIWASLQVGSAYCFFNISAGTVGTSANGGAGSIAAAVGAPGYWDCTLTVAAGSGGTTATVIVASADNTSVYTGDGSSGIYYARSHLTINRTTPLAYQKVTDWNTEYLAAASDSVGMWQDSAGNAPVTAVEQTVGLWMDQHVSSKWTVRSNYGWSISTGDGALTVSPDGRTVTITGATVLTRAVLSSPLPASGPGMQVMSVTLVSSSGGACGFYNRGGFTTASVVGQTYTSAFTINNANTDGVQVNVSGSATFRVNFMQHNTGSHAVQATTTSRPKLSARYNILTKTEQLTDAAWTTVGVAATSGFSAPDGSSTAWKVTEFSTTDRHYIYESLNTVNVASNEMHRSKIWAKRNGRDLRVSWVTGSSANGVYTDINLATGAVVNTGVDGLGIIGSVSCVSAGNGWWEITLDSALGIVTPSYYVLQLRADLVNTAGEPQYTGDSASGVFVWHPDHRITSDGTLNQPKYQRVNTATDYDTSGFIHYLKFDGVDDSLQTPNIDCSGVNKTVIWAGQTKLSDAAAAIFAEFTASATSNSGAWQMAFPANGAAPQYGFASRGTVLPLTLVTPNSYPAPITNVVVCTADIAAPSQAIRVNGTQVTTGSSSQGTGNFANAALNIGRRNNTNIPFNGRMTSLTMMGSTAAISTKFLRGMEQYTARVAGQTFVSS